MSLKPITSDLLLGVKHGFFTRLGGVSRGIYQGLNCGRGSNDCLEDVEANRKSVAEHFGGAEPQLQSVHQIHSAGVVSLKAVSSHSPKADAIVTATPGVILSVLTADCQPVLLYDAKAQVIGAAHAGSKGAKTGVLQNTIAAMETLGANYSNICAVIGPSISQKAYEVGPEFLEEICHDDPAALLFFTKGERDRYHFNLPSYGLSLLRGAGIKQAEWTGHCTYANPARFFSYRYSVHQNLADYGRLIACISL
jgi:YfiH family protein|tara:strand:+ start:4447 stop:5202 length:756 start_codon:yes stop_codon:yes gene_type:complete